MTALSYIKNVGCTKPTASSVECSYTRLFFDQSIIKEREDKRTKHNELIGNYFHQYVYAN